MELIKLESLEKEVESGFLQAARALREIKESNLHQQDYGTWENYLKERWGYSRDQWLKLSQSFSVINNLNDAKLAYLPQNQGQSRELATLQLEQQIEVWQKVTETYKPEEITAKKIRQVKNEILEPEIEVLEESEKEETLTITVDVNNFIESDNPAIRVLQYVYKEAVNQKVKQSFLDWLKFYLQQKINNYDQ